MFHFRLIIRKFVEHIFLGDEKAKGKSNEKREREGGRVRDQISHWVGF